MNKQNHTNNNNEDLGLDPKDQAYVSQHYQGSPHSMPSAATDTVILQQAKAQHSVTPAPTKVTLLGAWRTWQFAGSIAASVVIVALVFSFMPNPSEQFIDDELTGASYAVSDNAAVSLDTELESEFENNQRKAESKLLAQNTSLSFARKRATAQNANDLLSRLINIQTQLTLSHEEIMSVSSPEKMEQKELDEQGETSEFTLQIATYKLTHATLLRTLSENKDNGKDWDIDEKFMPVLSKEQWQNLMAPSAQK